MATIQYVVNAVDAASATFERIAGGADNLLHKLDEIGKKSETARLGLDGDKEMELTLDKLDLKMAKLGQRVERGTIGVEGQARALLDIRKVELELDKYNHKHVTATVDVNVNRQGLRGLLGKLGGGGAGGGGLLGLGQSGVGSIGLPLLGGGAVGGGLIAAGLVPGAVGLGLGGAAGLGAIGGGLLGAAEGKKALNADLANIKAITTQLKGAVGQQKKDLSAALKDASKQYQKDARFFQPFTTFQASIQGLLKTVLTPLRAVMGPLAGIFTQFGKGLAGLGPQFTALFQASLPFVKQFLQFMLQAGKILLPAFTTALNEMVKSGALKQMTDALVVLTQGLATFIVNLGPGMKASSVIFARVATAVGRVLGFLGDAFTVIAKVLAFDFPGAAKKGVNAVVASFKTFWHDVSAIFNTVKNYLIASWNATWDAGKRIVQAGVNAVTGFFRGLWHGVVSIFNTFRGDLATAWNTIWTKAKNAVTTGISAVVGFFRGLPGKAITALSGLGTSLYNFAHQALVKFGNGAKAVWNSILNWFKGLPSTILHALGIKSPPDWAISAGRHVMQGILNGLHLGTGGIAGFISHLPGKIGALLTGGSSGALGGDAGANKALARRIFPWGAAQWPAFVQLEMMEAGFNRFARNPSSGAYGIPQALPPTKMPFAAQAAGGSHAGPQLGWMFNYIAGRYGNPVNALSHELAYHWYDQGGALPPGLTLAYNATGQSEQVVGPGSMAQVVALLAQILAAVRIAPAATSAGTARALNSAARGAMR